MKKGAVRLIAIILAVVLLATLIIGAFSSVVASAVTQSEIDALKEEREKLTKMQAEIKAEINSLEFEQLSILAKKEVLDEQVNITEKKITVLNQQIEEYSDLIAQQEKEIRTLQRQQNTRLALYKERIRAMEENGTISYFAIIFDAKDFTDLLTRIDFISEIMKYDEQVYTDYLMAKNKTIRAQELTEYQKSAQEEVRVDVQAEKKVLESQVEEAQALIIEIESNLEKYKKEYEEMERQELEAQSEIDRLIAELQRQEAASGTIVNSTGSYIWPSAASKIVTSKFGTRFHPVLKVYKTHNGVDIGASYGTNVLAADSGVVVLSKSSSSYGNYIVINHGSGNTTLYAHMSKRLVSAGDSVTQGQVIGLVGSTGISNGPHIHFEITEGGTRVNPLKYFKDYVVQE